MTDNEEPILPVDPAPDHGSNFWDDLESSLQAEPRTSIDEGSETPTTVMAPVTATNSAGAGEPTSELPQVPRSTGGRGPDSPPVAPQRRSATSGWPLAAAAALVVVLALGFVALRSTTGSDSTDVVSSSDGERAETGLVPLQGSDTDSSDPGPDAETDTSASPGPDAIEEPAEDPELLEVIQSAPRSVEELRRQLVERDDGSIFEAALELRFTSLVQQEIAICMSEEGFDYVPFVGPPLSRRMDLAQDFSPIDSYVARLSSVADQDAGLGDSNQALVSSLSDSEQTAYLEHLWGPDGCFDAANRVVEGQVGRLFGTQLEPFEDALNEVAVTIFSTPEVVAARDAFGTCMQQSTGISFANENDLVNYFDSAISDTIDEIAMNSTEDFIAEEQLVNDPAVLALIDELRPVEAAVMAAYPACSTGLVEARERARKEAVSDVIEEFGEELTAFFGEEAVRAAPSAAPIVITAPGTLGLPRHAAQDQGVPDGSAFLGNWLEAELSWFALTTPGTACGAADNTSIVYVNASGVTQPFRDPQLTYSGQIAHFALSEQNRRAAWISACGSQLEFFVADLQGTGRVAEQQLVWVGSGTVEAAAMTWLDETVTFTAQDDQGSTFTVTYDSAGGQVLRDGGPIRVTAEVGAPDLQDARLIAASPDAALTYWSERGAGAVEAPCSERVADSDALLLRSAPNEWQSAIDAEGISLGRITAVAIEPQRGQVAFADVCDGGAGMLFLGIQQADGRISDIEEIDLSPFVPGFAVQLHWIDSQTLRVETDSSQFNAGVNRWDLQIGVDGERNIFSQID